MIIRTKGGDYKADSANSLLEFLGIKAQAQGIIKVSGEVELIASVPFVNESGEGAVWTLSTFDLDRDGERIDPQGWDYAQFVKNPVVQWAHCYDIPAIGKSEKTIADNAAPFWGGLINNQQE